MNKNFIKTRKISQIPPISAIERRYLQTRMTLRDGVPKIRKTLLMGRGGGSRGLSSEEGGGGAPLPPGEEGGGLGHKPRCVGARQRVHVGCRGVGVVGRGPGGGGMEYLKKTEVKEKVK